MAHTDYSIELSLEADIDLQKIYDYTEDAFGPDQALGYLKGLDELFQTLRIQPHTGRQRTDIRAGLRSISYVSHIVFYRVIETKVRIVRVLHASRDIPKFL